MGLALDFRCPRTSGSLSVSGPNLNIVKPSAVSQPNAMLKPLLPCQPQHSINPSNPRNQFPQLFFILLCSLQSKAILRFVGEEEANPCPGHGAETDVEARSGLEVAERSGGCQLADQREIDQKGEGERGERGRHRGDDGH